MQSIAGPDRGSVEHAARVLDEQGAVAPFDVRHTAEGLQRLLAPLARIAPPEELPATIERPSGLVVDTLVEAGHPVVLIHPNAVQIVAELGEDPERFQTEDRLAPSAGSEGFRDPHAIRALTRARVRGS